MDNQRSSPQVDAQLDIPPAGLSTLFNTPEADLTLLKEYNFIDVMLETSQAIVLFLDQAGKILFFNPFFEQLSGYALAEVRGKEWFTLFLSETEQMQIRDVHQTVLTTQHLHSTINPIITRTGQEKLIEWHNKTLHDAEGSICGTFSYGHDITEKYFSDLMLKIQRDVANIFMAATNLPDAFHAFFKILQDIKGFDTGSIYVLDESKNILNLVASHNLSDALKSQLETIFPESHLRNLIDLGLPVYSLFDDFRKNTTLTNPMGLKAAAIIPVFQHQKLVASFHLASLSLDEIPFPARQLLESIGPQIGVLVQQAQSETLLRLNEERYRSVIEISHDCLWEMDPQGTYTYISQHIQGMLGYHPSELLGKHWTHTLVENEKHRFQNMLVHINQQALPPTFHKTITRHLHKYKGMIYLESNGVLFQNNQNEAQGMRGNHRDITLHKRTEALLNTQRDIAYQLNNTLSLKEGLREVFEILTKQIDEIDFCAVLLPGQEKKDNQIYFSHDLDNQAMEFLFSFTDQTHAFMPNSKNQPRYFHYKAFEKFSLVPKMLDLSGAALIPLLNEQTPVGTFFIASRKYNSLPRDLRHMLEIICTHLGSTIETIHNRQQLQQQKEKYLNIFNAASDAVMLIDGTTILDCNEAALKMFLISTNTEMRGTSFLNYFPPRQPDGRNSEDIFQLHAEETASKERVRFKWVYCRKNGETFPAEVLLTTFCTQDRNYTQVNIRDISVQVKNQKNLQKSMEIQSSLYELISLSLEKYSLDEFLNHVASQFMSLTWMGKMTNNAIFLCTQDDPRFHLKAAKGISIEQKKQLQKINLSDFAAQYADCMTLPIFACRDHQLINILQTSGDQSVWTCPLRDSKNHLWGMVILTACQQQNFDSVAEAFFFTSEQMIISILQRKQAEQTFQTEYVRMDYLINSIPSVIIAINKNNEVTLWNHAAEKLFNLSITDVLGQKFPDCKIAWEWSSTLQHIPDVLRSFKPLKFENIRFTRPDQTDGFLDLLITPIRGTIHQFSEFLLVGIDRTEQKSLETQLLHSQKMESIGQLAAGIAHEINTPTQYVGDNIRFLQDSFGDIFELLDKFQLTYEKYKTSMTGNEAEELGQAIQDLDLEYLQVEVPQAVLQSLEGVERVSTIVKAMKGFAHPDGNRDMAPSDLNQGIQNTVTVSRNEWKYVAETEVILDPSLPLVPCLPGEINQVILNIIVNASHAIESKLGEQSESKGKIVVSSKFNPPWAEIRIRDNGGGIPKKIQDRIFDPFFTTKEVGKGTGQGLAIARSVIKDKHKGEISFMVEENVGTTFLIQLPLEHPQENDSDG